MIIEKRKFSRFEVKDNAYIALGRGYVKVGKVKNISSSGASFEYIENPDLHKITPRKMDIFVSGESFYLPDIPCRIVYDIPRNSASTFLPSFIIKQCGLKFGMLSDDQFFQLQIFLLNHTTNI